MAVTLSVQELAVGLRISADPAASVPEPQLGILTRLLAVATALVEGRAPGADAETQNEAAIRICGWLYDKPTHNRTGGISAFHESGAAALLAPHAVRVMESV